MGKDCYQGDLFINIGTFVVTVVCLIVVLISQMFVFALYRMGELFDRSIIGQCCFISLDGTDFNIQEPSPFDPKWFSHKFEGPGG